MNNQLLVRNLVWNKHFTNMLINNEKESKKYTFFAEEMINKLQEDQRISYCIFSIEKGRKQNEMSFHFQGYTEFSRPVDALAFKKEWYLNDVCSRKGTQQQAIDYITKEQSKIHDQVYEFGIPKKQGMKIERYNKEDPDIPKNMDDQRLLLNKRLKDKTHYFKFEDIEKDVPLLFIKNKKWCKNLWDEYNPLKILNIKPAKTIWVYGHSGVGKTTWTNDYLVSLNFKDGEITKKKASNTIRPKLWFDIEDENKKVLWVEEIRENFPDFNDIIQIIDKGTRLEVKGSQIANNYELIIFNSLHSPEHIYKKLPLAHQIEILRRLYRGNDSKVYEIIPGRIKLNKTFQNPWTKDWITLIDHTDELPNILKKHYEK